VKVYVGTNGCVEAQMSSMLVKKHIEINQFNLVDNVNEADLIIFAACGLTEERELDSLAMVRDIKINMKSSSKLIVWGCLPKTNPETLAKIYDGPSIGLLETNLIEELLGSAKISSEKIVPSAPSEELKSLHISKSNNNDLDDSITRTILLSIQMYNKLTDKIQKRTKPYYIRVATGCTGYCTYCSEKPIFGGIKSRSIEDAVLECKEGLKLGYNRISLLATDLGAYGFDININLSDLLNKLVKINNGDYKIILNQVEPKNFVDIYPNLKDIFRSGKIEELNCPVQSGSNRILKLMGRDYTIEEWINYILMIHKEFPKIKISTHIMVGFPTETEEDFNATMKLLKILPFLSIYIFKYSSRPAASAKNIRDQISEEIKEQRRKELLHRYTRMKLLNFI